EFVGVGHRNALRLEAVEEMGAHPAGDDGRRAHATLASLDAERAAEADQAPLRGVICAGVGPRARPSSRRNVDEMPVALLAHGWQDSLRQQKGPAEIDPDDLVPLRDAKLFDG